MVFIQFSIVLSICFIHSIDAFGIRNSDSQPPEPLAEMAKPIHDLCVNKTGVSEDMIQQFIDADVSQIDNTDYHLKCYMFCFDQGLTNHAQELEQALDMLRVREFRILTNMNDQCKGSSESSSDSWELPSGSWESLSHSWDTPNDLVFMSCDYGFEYETCWKRADPDNYYNRLQFFSSHIRRKWNPIHDLCVNKTKVSDDIVQQFINADDSQIEYTDNDLKCYMHCILYEFEHQLSRPGPETYDIHSDFEFILLIAMFVKCDVSDGEEFPGGIFVGCDEAFELEKCMKKADPDHYYLL